MPISRATAAAALLACLACACGSSMSGTYQEAVARWNLGDAEGTLTVARKTYEKFRDDNGLAEAAVAKAARDALQELDELPVLPKGETPRTFADHDPAHAGPNQLQLEVRADLTSTAVTVALRAAAVVRDFRLRSEVPGLLLIIYRREAFKDDGGILVGLSTALRSVAVKWGALDVLERVIRSKPTKLQLPPAPR